MAITYSLLLEADFSVLESTGEFWGKLYQALEEQAGVLVGLKSTDDAPFGIDHWDGQSGEAARERVRDTVLALDDRSAGARRVSVAIADAVEEFKGAQTDLNDVIAEIDYERVALLDTGSIIPDTSRGTDNVYYAEGLNSRITAALDRATEADEALKAAVGIWAETFSASERQELVSAAEDEAGELQELIDSGASPEQINDWWSGLSEAERIGILEGDPGLIAGLDGIPTDTRDAANRDLLEAEIDRFSPTLDQDIAELEAQLEEMRANGEQYIQSGYRGPLTESTEYLELQEQLETLQGEQSRLDSLVDLQDAISGQASTGQDYYLLDYNSNEDGKAIVSVGNPDSADNTAVYVPGTTSDLENFGGSVERAETMAYDSQEVAPGQETAVIAWLDYDAPDEAIFDAFSMDYAEDAGPTLSQFTEGLESTHTGDGAHTTIVGHSYGTTVVGHTAAEYGVEADKIIAVASPGMDSDSAAELGVENVYATSAEGDAIRTSTDTYSYGPQFIDSLVDAVDSVIDDPHTADDQGDGYYAWHGQHNPVHEDYGATQFPSEATDSEGNPTDDGVDIHGGYWADGNVARENMAYIITDQPDRLHPPED